MTNKEGDKQKKLTTRQTEPDRMTRNRKICKITQKQFFNVRRQHLFCTASNIFYFLGGTGWGGVQPLHILLQTILNLQDFYQNQMFFSFLLKLKNFNFKQLAKQRKIRDKN